MATPNATGGTIDRRNPDSLTARLSTESETINAGTNPTRVRTTLMTIGTPYPRTTHLVCWRSRGVEPLQYRYTCERVRAARVPMVISQPRSVSGDVGISRVFGSMRLNRMRPPPDPGRLQRIQPGTERPEGKRSQ